MLTREQLEFIMGLADDAGDDALLRDARAEWHDIEDRGTSSLKHERRMGAAVGQSVEVVERRYRAQRTLRRARLVALLQAIEAEGRHAQATGAPWWEQPQVTAPTTP